MCNKDTHWPLLMSFEAGMTENSVTPISVSLFYCSFSLTRYGGDRVLPSPGWASHSSQFTLWRQFSGVPWYPHLNWLPHRHLLWHFCFSGCHYGQLLPRFYSSLFSAPEQRRQRRRRGREWLMRRGHEELYYIKCKCFTLTEGKKAGCCGQGEKSTLSQVFPCKI